MCDAESNEGGRKQHYVEQKRGHPISPLQDANRIEGVGTERDLNDSQGLGADGPRLGFLIAPTSLMP